MNTFKQLWLKLAKSKKYREEFVASQVKRGIPFQIRTLMKQKGFSQEDLAGLSGLTQGVVSRAANPDYGNLTLNTVIRVAAGFDVAFIGRFVPFSELGRWFTSLSEESGKIPTFEEENSAMERRVSSGEEVNDSGIVADLDPLTPERLRIEGREEAGVRSRELRTRERTETALNRIKEEPTKTLSDVAERARPRVDQDISQIQMPA